MHEELGGGRGWDGLGGAEGDYPHHQGQRRKKRSYLVRWSRRYRSASGFIGKMTLLELG